MLHLKNQVSQQKLFRTSLVVHWLRLHTFNARCACSIPDQRTKIPHALWPKTKINKRFPNHNSAVEGKIIKAMAVMQLMLKETRNQKILLIRTKQQLGKAKSLKKQQRRWNGWNFPQRILTSQSIQVSQGQRLFLMNESIFTLIPQSIGSGFVQKGKRWNLDKYHSRSSCSLVWIKE